MNAPTIRSQALVLATDVHVKMLQIAQALGLDLEDRSTSDSHVYLARAGTNPIWNLSISIQFNASMLPAATMSPGDSLPPPSRSSKPNVTASINLMYARKLVYYLEYDGRHDHWELQADTDSDDAASWDEELPHRKHIKDDNSVDANELKTDWQSIVQIVIRFYQKRSESIMPKRMRSMPPPPSLPPGQVPTPGSTTL